MAVISFTGFVEEVLEGRNGVYGLKVAEPHSRKDDNDKWVTVARTFHRVTGAYQAGIEWGQFSKGDRVEVAGKQVTDPYTDNQGKKQYPLAVKAESVVFAGSGAAPVAAPDSWGAPAPFDDDASVPF